MILSDPEFAALQKQHYAVSIVSNPDAASRKWFLVSTDDGASWHVDEANDLIPVDEYDQKSASLKNIYGDLAIKGMTYALEEFTFGYVKEDGVAKISYEDRFLTKLMLDNLMNKGTYLDFLDRSYDEASHTGETDRNLDLISDEHFNVEEMSAQEYHVYMAKNIKNLMDNHLFKAITKEEAEDMATLSPLTSERLDNQKPDADISEKALGMMAQFQQETEMLENSANDTTLTMLWNERLLKNVLKL